jgi:hypothetical protein
MIELWKLRLRAWLIDLVREAIRREQISARFVIKPDGVTRFTAAQIDDLFPPSPQPASKPLTPTEPSFEQMEREALSAQEKHYEPGESEHVA